MSDEFSSALVRELLVDGNWFRFPRHFLHFMDLDEAVMISYLVNFANRVNADDTDGWFYCTVGTIRRDLCFSPDRQKRTLVKLAYEKDPISEKPAKNTVRYIELTKRGLPPVRWMKIDYDRLQKDLNFAVMRDLKDRKKRAQSG